MSEEELIEKLDLDENIVKKNVQFWTKKGILIEENEKIRSVLSIAEIQEKENNQEELDVESEDDVDEEQLTLIKQVINGMLINYKELPVDLIHDMLGWMGNYTKTLPQLKEILNKMVKEETLNCSGNIYSLPS